MMDDWKTELDTLFQQKQDKEEHEAVQQTAHAAEAAAFINTKVMPAFEELKAELEKRGRQVEVSHLADYDKPYAHIKVKMDGREELDYKVEVRVNPRGAFAVAVTRFWDEGQRYKAEGYFRSGAQDYDVNSLTKEEILRNVLEEYKRRVSHR